MEPEAGLPATGCGRPIPKQEIQPPWKLKHNSLQDISPSDIPKLDEHVRELLAEDFSVPEGVSVLVVVSRLEIKRNPRIAG